jgi:hypothetical protein
LQTATSFAEGLRQTVLAMNKSLGSEREQFLADFHRSLTLALGRPELMRKALWR